MSSESTASTESVDECLSEEEESSQLSAQKQSDLELQKWAERWSLKRESSYHDLTEIQWLVVKVNIMIKSSVEQQLSMPVQSLLGQVQNLIRQQLTAYSRLCKVMTSITEKVDKYISRRSKSDLLSSSMQSQTSQPECPDNSLDL